VKKGVVTLVDCYPVSKSHIFEGVSKKISFARDIWARGSRPTYAEVLRRFPMATGGRWVWQEDMVWAPRDGRQEQRGRGHEFGRPTQNHPPLPPPHLQVQG
jgi:hypothetical protein